MFGYYINSHQAIVSELKHINVWLLIILLACYGLMLLVLMTLYNAILHLCSDKLKPKENLLLSIYSTLTNFFMPLQGGIAVRAGYLKRKHKVSVSSYIIAFLIYYAIYAVISIILVFTPKHYFWLILPMAVAVALFSYLVIKLALKHFKRLNKPIKLDLSRAKLYKLVLFTIAQVSLQALIYYIELNQVTGNLNPLRAISYTGAANFSIFTAITPGAIGFREAFLSVSKRMHGFTNSQIVAANIIDRGVFLVFIVGLFIVMISTHANNRFKANKKIT